MLVFPHVTDVFLIGSVIKQEILEFIRPGGMKKWILLCELHQEFLEFVVMYDPGISCVNGMKGCPEGGYQTVWFFSMNGNYF